MKLILAVIFIAFIGVGIPDSLFGAAWPAMQVDLGLPVSTGGIISFLTSGGIVLSVLLSAKFIAKWGTVKVMIMGTFLMAAALLGFSFVGGAVGMALCAILLGFAKGTPDAAMNDYVAVHYSGTQINFLHCFYGVGVVVSPYLMSMVLENATWRDGYRILCLLMAVIGGIVLCSLPVWRKQKVAEESEEGDYSKDKAGEQAEVQGLHAKDKSVDGEAGIKAEETKTLSLKEMLKNPSIRVAWILSAATNSVEAICAAWGSTYLVLAHGLDSSAAAGAVTFFFLGMALGRFVTGLLSKRLSAWKLIFIGFVLCLCGVLLLFVPVPAVATGGLLLIGFGNGPIYPNLIYLTPGVFGNQVSASVVSSQIISAYAGFMIAPPIFGFLSQYLGQNFFGIYLLLWVLIFAGAMKWFAGKYQKQL